MTIGLGQSLRLLTAHRCEVCDRLRNEEQATSDTAEAALFGHVAYAVCPGCRQIAHPPLFADEDYRRKYRLYRFLNHGVVMRDV